MIDWIDEMCRAWGRQKRRIIGDPAVIQDPVALCLVESRRNVVRGIAPSGQAVGIAGRLVDEGPVGAAIRSAILKDPPEVLTGDALKVAIGIQCAIHARALTERQHEALIVHYIVKASLEAKLQRLAIGRKSLYDRIHRAHLNIEPFLDGDTVTVERVAVA